MYGVQVFQPLAFLISLLSLKINVYSALQTFRWRSDVNELSTATKCGVSEGRYLYITLTIANIACKQMNSQVAYQLCPDDFYLLDALASRSQKRSSEEKINNIKITSVRYVIISTLPVNVWQTFLFSLTHFRPLLPFYNHWNIRKSHVFSGLRTSQLNRALLSLIRDGRKQHPTKNGSLRC